MKSSRADDSHSCKGSFNPTVIAVRKGSALQVQMVQKDYGDRLLGWKDRGQPVVDRPEQTCDEQ